MTKPVIIFGGKGLAKAAIDIFKSNNIVIYGVLDDDKKIHGSEIDDVSILGSTDDEEYLKILGKKCDAFLAYDDMRVRKSLVKSLTDSYKAMPINAIHSSAFISNTAQIHHGSLINAHSTVGAYASIGNHCIIHTGAIIDHEVELADFVQVGAGSVINSAVKIDKGAFIGSGVTIISGVTIGKNASIGAGSVVIENVKEGERVFGNPAKVV